MLELRESVLNPLLNPVLRVFGHRQEIDDIVLRINRDAEKLVIITGDAGVWVGSTIVLMGIALRHQLPARDSMYFNVSRNSGARDISTVFGTPSL